MNIHRLIVAYIAGLFVLFDLLSAWFISNLAQHVWNFIHHSSGTDEEVFTKDDLLIASTRYGKWGDLWTCPLCLGTWLSFAVAASIVAVVDLPWWFIPLAVFSWSGIAFRLGRFK